MMMQVTGLFLLLIAISLGLMSAVCIICFRRPEVERRERRLSFRGFLRKPRDYLRRPFAGLSWGMGVLAVVLGIAGIVLLLMAMAIAPEA